MLAGNGRAVGAPRVGRAALRRAGAGALRPPRSQSLQMINVSRGRTAARARVFAIGDSLAASAPENGNASVRFGIMPRLGPLPFLRIGRITHAQRALWYGSCYRWLLRPH